MFLAYLQGIETDGQCKAAVIHVLFLAYLQGIETSSFRSLRDFHLHVSSLPTRD